mgnify:CR=1 FL=1
MHEAGKMTDEELEELEVKVGITGRFFLGEV